MSILEVKGLEVSYGRIMAVKGASLSLGEGEIRVILGSNGAGKSSIIKTIMGVTRARGGTIEFPPGREIQTLRADQINALGIAWVPEGRHVFTTLTVMENLLIGSFRTRAKGTVRTRLERILTMFPILRERQTQVAGALSGGEQQMLAFGRALMSDPRVLLLDEPSLGLAPKIVRQLFDIVGAIRDQGVSVLMAEQNARQALRVADHGYLLEVGEVRSSGPVEDLERDEQIRRVYLGG